MPISLDINIAAIAGAVVWPVFIGVLIVRYRQEIGPFLKEISKRVSKFSIGPFSLELAEIKGFEPKWKGDGPMDLRQTGISGFRSLAPDLVTQIEESSVVDFAIFDLGDGNNWLSTRLYLFAVVLHRMRRLKTIVFVDRRNGIRHHFVGIAEPSRVYYTLASRYPWLERAFARTYGNLPDVKITTVYGSIDQFNAVQLVENFLLDFEIQRAPDPPGATPPPGWVVLNQGNTWEHADWLDTGKVEGILEQVLNRSWINKVELGGKSTSDQAKLVLSFNAPFVAVVDQERRFENLIDTQWLLDKITRNVMLEY